MDRGDKPVVIVPNPKAKSEVWSYFGFPGADDGSGRILTKTRAICRLCTEDQPYKNNTSNLFYHLERHHKDVYAKLKKSASTSKESQQSSIAESFAASSPLSDSSVRHKQLVDAVGSFIVQDLRPINVVEGKGFRQLMKVAEPRFKLPSRTYFSKSVIPAKYATAKEELATFLEGIKHCSITTDIWTAKYQVRSYVSLTCHAIDSEWQLKSMILCTRELPEEHTADNLSDALKEMMTEWKILSKVVGSSTDNARNIGNAMRNLGIFNMPCIGHTLQLSVLKSFDVDQVSRALARLRMIAGHFHRSPKASAKLREKQQLLGLPTHKILNDCVTRWGSTFAMLKRFIEQQQAICAVFLENRDSRQFMPSDAELSAVEELVSVLDVLNSATEIVSGEKYPTLGIVVPLLHKLLSHTLAETESDKRLAKKIKRAIREDLMFRYQDDLVKTKLSVATYLDPRFKALSFLDSQEKTEVLADVKFAILEIIDADQQQQVAEAVTEPEPSEPSSKKKKLAKFFEDVIGPSEQSQSLSPEDIAENEVRKYKAEDALSLDNQEPLKWWQAREHQLKYLSCLVKQVFCITASSVPSERLFSSAGNLVNEKRSYLSPENVDCLLFLYENTRR